MCLREGKHGKNVGVPRRGVLLQCAAPYPRYRWVRWRNLVLAHEQVENVDIIEVAVWTLAVKLLRGARDITGDGCSARRFTRAKVVS